MIFGKFMTFLFYAGWIGSHEVKPEKVIGSFVLINLQVLLLLSFGLLRVKALAKIQRSIKIMLDFSTIN